MRIIIIDPDLEERKLEGYYFMRYYCRNCGNSSCLGFNGVDVMIPIGVLKVPSLFCPNCKCRELRS